MIYNMKSKNDTSHPALFPCYGLPKYLTSNLISEPKWSFSHSKTTGLPKVNQEYTDKFEAADLKYVGRDESGKRMEIVEHPTHPFYVGVQFHPEFKSRPGRRSALFLVKVVQV